MRDLALFGLQVPAVAALATGVALLFLGRRLFWLFVGLLGAVAGLWFARQVLGLPVEGTGMLVAVAAGVLGALLAILLQRVAIALSGFLAGAAGMAYLLEVLHFGLDTLPTLVLALVGGVIGAILGSLLFEVALVVLTSVTGALLVVAVLEPPGTWGPAALVVFALAGALVQVKRWLPGSRAKRSKEAG